MRSASAAPRSDSIIVRLGLRLALEFDSLINPPGKAQNLRAWAFSLWRKSGDGPSARSADRGGVRGVSPSPRKMAGGIA